MGTKDGHMLPFWMENLNGYFSCKITSSTNAELAGIYLEMSGNKGLSSICVGIPSSASKRRAFMSLEVKFDPLQNDYMLVLCPKMKLHSYEKWESLVTLNSLFINNIPKIYCILLGLFFFVCCFTCVILQVNSGTVAWQAQNAALWGHIFGKDGLEVRSRWLLEQIPFT